MQAASKVCQDKAAGLVLISTGDIRDHELMVAKVERMFAVKRSSGAICSPHSAGAAAMAASVAGAARVLAESVMLVICGGDTHDGGPKLSEYPGCTEVSV